MQTKRSANDKADMAFSSDSAIFNPCREFFGRKVFTGNLQRNDQGILWQFRHKVPETRERQALRLMALSFFALAAYVSIESVRALVAGEQPQSSPVGIGLAIASLMIMPFLSWAQRQTGKRLGSNAVVVKPVPAGATMVGQKARSTLVKAETYARDFMPYGTPCREIFDPTTQSLEIMQCEIEALRKKVAELMTERDATSNVASAKPSPAKIAGLP